MASEEVTITVSTEVDTSSLDALETMLDEITMTAEGIGDSINEGLNGIDPSGVQETGDNAKEAADGLEDMSGAANDAKDAVDGIDSGNIDDVSSSADSAASDMEAMGSAAAAVGAGATLTTMADTAGNIEDSYNRLKLTFGGVSTSMQSDMNKASSATGRSGAMIRGYFNDMGIAGVKDTKVLEDSFEGLSGRSYQTGRSIDTMEKSLQRMVLTGKASGMQLKNLGLNTDDLDRAMQSLGFASGTAFDSLSQTDRLRVLTAAMGDQTAANNMNKDSWQNVKDRASASMAGLMGAVGKPMLSVLIPAVNAATSAITWLSSSFSALPGPLQTIIGVVGGAGMGFFALVASLAALSKVLNGVKSGLAIMNSILEINTGVKAANTGATSAHVGAEGADTVATDTNTAATNYNNLSLMDNIRALFTNIASRVQQVASFIASTAQTIINTAQTMLNTIQTQLSAAAEYIRNSAIVTSIVTMVTRIASFIADTVVKAANAVATFALAVAEWLLASPILIVVIAVVAAIAIFLYFYNSNEQVRNSVNALIAAFWNFLAAVAGAIMGAVGYITSLPGRAWNALMQTINRVLQFGGQFINNLRSAALRGVLGFISSITSLPGKLASELSRTLNNVISWGSQIVAKFGGIAQQAWQAFIGGLGIGSPGYISIQTDTELQRVSDSADAFKSQYQRKFEVLGQTVTGAYTSGNSTITTNLPSTAGNATGGVSNNGGNVTINIQGDVLNDKLVNKIVKEITNALKFDNTKAGRTIGDVSG